jgi:zinc transport system ATP-binding protein
MSTPLAFRDGAVALGGRPVLRGIDLAVSEAEVVALLGSNGSGKSTLVRAAMGLVPLVRGEVALFDTPLARFASWQRVGYVPQRPTAGAGVPATVREVVASGRLARRRLLRPLRGGDRAAVDAALEAVGLADRRHDGAAQLSGGQQQRVLIARALAGEPDLLVLDEPTAGVDVRSQHAFAEALRRVTARGATVLLVAHDLGALEPLVDRAVVLHDGRVVYDGAPQPAAGTHAFHDHAHPERAPGPTILGGWRL